ncbi:monocopper oxidase protein SKU5 [Trifolium repens]|nr:monocopper oxidase protein SKU5 [Trifolium repens]
MASFRAFFFFLINIFFLLTLSSAEDALVPYTFEISYITASPLGVPQQVIAINGEFPGPTINVTTNNNVAVNVHNKLDENLLIHWSGVQQRRTSWQDGVLGTNCPIPPKWNWTYQFQVKDQIGSFFYFPSLNFQRAAGGFGGFIINNRPVISVPFDTPQGDIVVFIGDWYTRNHTDLRKDLDDGKDLGMPNGVLINGKGPYRYNDTLVPDGIDFEQIDVKPGKTYRIRGKAKGHLPPGPDDQFDKTFSMNQARSIRWNVSASGARPNPQGSFRYGSINNNDTKMHTYHLNGYAFFVVGMDFGDWSENSRGTYNKWDGIARTTAQVYPGAWTAVLVSLDNVGIWNLRTENLDSWYLGQETYIRVVNPEPTNKTELPMPDNALFCGSLQHLQKPQKIISDASINGNGLKLIFTLVMFVCAIINIFQ